MQRRRRLVELLATLALGFSGTVGGQETELAYYTSDPNRATEQVRTVSTTRPVIKAPRSILLANAQQDQQEIVDLAIPSSSDLPDEGDDFLSDPPPVSPQSIAEDVDAVVQQSQAPALSPTPALLPPAPAPLPTTPAPLASPINESTARAMRAPVAPQPNLGAVYGSYSSAPNMMGDFFGATFALGSFIGHTVALAGGDRRFKVAENTSPIPQNRVFFNYNHFHNALRDVNDVTRNLDRFTFGAEKTFWDGMASIEARLPFASALDSTQAFGVTDTASTELGNMGLTSKFTLLSGCDWLVSGGATLTLPTGDDFRLFNGNIRQLLVQNDAVHLAPFLGFIKVPNRNWFVQGFLQADFDLNGNDVFTDFNGFEGVLQDQNLLFMDVSVGRWLYRSCDPCDCLSGVAAIAELHYTTTMNDTDDVGGVSNPFNRMDLLNATAALNFQVGKTALRVGGAAPLRDDEEHLFDAEVLVQLNRNF